MPLAFGSSLGAGSRSSTTGRTPASASSHATISPLGPAPEMTTGTWFSVIGFTWFGQSGRDLGKAATQQCR